MVKIIMVIIMETRIEKNKRLAKEKRIKGFKLFIILFMVALLVIGIGYVNKTIKEYNFFDNPNLFSISLKRNTLIILGEKYYFDFRILKKQ